MSQPVGGDPEIDPSTNGRLANAAIVATVGGEIALRSATTAVMPGARVALTIGYAGATAHKISDTTWTGLPLVPAADAKARAQHRPSTAATPNLAAIRAGRTA